MTQLWEEGAVSSPTSSVKAVPSETEVFKERAEDAEGKLTAQQQEAKAKATRIATQKRNLGGSPVANSRPTRNRIQTVNKQVGKPTQDQLDKHTRLKAR